MFVYYVCVQERELCFCKSIIFSYFWKHVLFQYKSTRYRLLRTVCVAILYANMLKHIVGLHLWILRRGKQMVKLSFPGFHTSTKLAQSRNSACCDIPIFWIWVFSGLTLEVGEIISRKPDLGTFCPWSQMLTEEVPETCSEVWFWLCIFGYWIEFFC